MISSVASVEPESTTTTSRAHVSRSRVRPILGASLKVRTTGVISASTECRLKNLRYPAGISEFFRLDHLFSLPRLVFLRPCLPNLVENIENIDLFAASLYLMSRYLSRRHYLPRAISVPGHNCCLARARGVHEQSEILHRGEIAVGDASCRRAGARAARHRRPAHL